MSVKTTFGVDMITEVFLNMIFAVLFKFKVFSEGVGVEFSCKQTQTEVPRSRPGVADGLRYSGAVRPPKETEITQPLLPKIPENNGSSPADYRAIFRCGNYCHTLPN